jgi:hypothetical protein
LRRACKVCAFIAGFHSARRLAADLLSQAPYLPGIFHAFGRQGLPGQSRFLQSHTGSESRSNFVWPFDSKKAVHN